ncbi:MAG: MurR/RpiR family transcriptional regulator [Proteobacteria bacterium]|nr:MurR/RpiR family transcriptional regulator [Pseudomonadota bacterium]
MKTSVPVPKTAAELRQAIVERYDSLSKRLQLIARHALDHPDDFALQTLAVISARSGAQPSAIVRFSKTFGFSGASDMQRLFRDSLVSSNAALGYGERVRRFGAQLQGSRSHGVAALLQEFVDGSALALQSLAQTVGEGDLERAIELLKAADTVFVAGFRRAFPVASYLAYSLQQAGKRTSFVDGVAGLSAHQVKNIRTTDALLAVSYRPYAPETVQLVEAAAAAGTPILAISDSPVSPIARLSTRLLLVREMEVRSFRSLAASLCLAQALAIGFAFIQSAGAHGSRRRGSLK